MKKMNMTEVKKRAKRLGVTPEKTAKKGEIIRAIQAAEGNSQCFGTGIAETCGQEKCCWRPDCLEV
jgi:hypothetical protein